MCVFSAILKFLGNNVVDALQLKYGSNLVGYGMMIFANTTFLIPQIFIKMNPQIDFSLAMMVRGLVATIFIF